MTWPFTPLGCLVTGERPTRLVGDASEVESVDIRELEQQFQVLHRQREQLKQAINRPAVVAGSRRS